MYYPYFRGKQFELIAIRESATLIAESGFVPIIEPVRESLGGLEKALSALAKAGAQAVVVINPRYGDHREGGDNITAFLERDYRGNDAIRPGILLTSETSITEAVARIRDTQLSGTSLIHSGFTESRSLAEALGTSEGPHRNIFLDAHTNMLYRRHFQERPRVLIGDGFLQMKNSAYQPIDAFSDLHVTYIDRGMDGYGDFLTVGDNYSEGGGPAYAVAIHLTFIDPEQDNAMFVYHFISDTNDTPTDPAGKFAQALEKLISALNSGQSNLVESSAVAEFRDLYSRGHFPGLGYVKKLSIKHHLETLSDYHARL
ncbi:sce7725 family protein [Aeromicrobium sp. CnD17-E]|uniref:sce7725 family protein n=1 Tax=Aeromicrobium sp. CnD17-E TaxID=2954487 RepID=UPI002096B02C|nr:sce7725 family protein [Aeromicrobium sp. CnD17-E]MCO7237830.1 sce7725 family protein [Aeromicrobium sp. CnD17-E]